METQILILAVTLGGLIKGLNGFGYALVSTSLLTTILPAQQAVSLMIIPIIISNLELTTKLTFKELKHCINRFKLYILGLFLGITLGMSLISYIPSLLLKRLVGLIVIIFVASRTPKISKIFSTAKNYCVENPRTEPVLGLISGVIFGSSNLGVPVVAYFKQLKLSREKFVSVIAVTILFASVLRVGLASYLGLYSGPDKILLSALLGIPGLLAVKTGDILGEKMPSKITEKPSLILLTIIGLKLLGTF